MYRALLGYCCAVALSCTGPGGSDGTGPPPGEGLETPLKAHAPAAQDTELRVEDLPPGRSPELRQGRDIFVANCTKCHVEGLGDAPLVVDTEAWAPRIAQNRELLYAHATEGFWGDVGEMPPRGDNDALSDADVRRAVDYILSIHTD